MKKIENVKIIKNTSYPKYLYFWIEKKPFVSDKPIPHIWHIGAEWYLTKEAAEISAPSFGEFELVEISNPWPENIFLHITNKQ